MFLALDLGNTHLKLGLFRGAALVRAWRLSSDPRRTADELALALGGLLGRSARSVTGCAVASVVPALDPALREACVRLFRRAPVVVDHRSRLGFTVGYQPPSDVGADRLADAAAALRLVGAPVIVADFGTALTINVVDRRRVYLGGAIAPGPALALESLFRRAARLPQVAAEAPRAAVGRSSGESLRSGAVFGAAALVDGLLERVFRELGERPPVIATGGAAPLVVPHARLLKRIEPDLTLHGIRQVAGGAR